MIFILPLLSALAAGLVLGWTISFLIQSKAGEKQEEQSPTRDTPLNDGEDLID